MCVVVFVVQVRMRVTVAAQFVEVGMLVNEVVAGKESSVGKYLPG
jgi:hypothetical protein